MPKIIDMTGQVFGHLTVLSRVPATGQARWLCACRCGKETIQAGYDLRKGVVKSCGCMKKERLGAYSKTHGMTGTREYMAWVNMRNRCLRPGVRGYERYGAVGITVCRTWANSFENFFSDMGACPNGHTLDRIDNSKGYDPSNCRWAPLSVQSNNKNRIKVATFNGATKSIAEWCRELNLPHRTIRARIYELGWQPEIALTTPIRNG